MKILISNDDGFQAPGIVALHDALKDIAEVEVVAPEHNNSAKSNALTLAAPLYVHTAHNGFRYVTGTPADCVHIALKGLLGYRPDLVVSRHQQRRQHGRRHHLFGHRRRRDGGLPVRHSGHRVLADREGLGARRCRGARGARAGASRSSASACSSGSAFLLNVNMPNLPFDELKPVKVCRLGRRHAAEKVITQDSPRGETMYWIAGAGGAKDSGEGTDFHATAAGPHRADAAADRPDRPRQSGPVARHGGAPRRAAA